MRKPP
jgi:hypothetical protein